MNRYAVLTEEGNIGIFEPYCEGSDYSFPDLDQEDPSEEAISGSIVCAGCVLPYLQGG